MRDIPRSGAITRRSLGSAGEKGREATPCGRLSQKAESTVNLTTPAPSRPRSTTQRSKGPTPTPQRTTTGEKEKEKLACRMVMFRERMASRLKERGNEYSFVKNGFRGGDRPEISKKTLKKGGPPIVWVAGTRTARSLRQL